MAKKEKLHDFYIFHLLYMDGMEQVHYADAEYDLGQIIKTKPYYRQMVQKGYEEPVVAMQILEDLQQTTRKQAHKRMEYWIQQRQTSEMQNLHGLNKKTYHGEYNSSGSNVNRSNEMKMGQHADLQLMDRVTQVIGGNHVLADLHMMHNIAYRALNFFLSPYQIRNLQDQLEQVMDVLWVPATTSSPIIAVETCSNPEEWWDECGNPNAVKVWNSMLDVVRLLQEVVPEHTQWNWHRNLERYPNAEQWALQFQQLHQGKAWKMITISESHGPRWKEILRPSLDAFNQLLKLVVPHEVHPDPSLNYQQLSDLLDLVRSHRQFPLSEDPDQLDLSLILMQFLRNKEEV